MVTLVAVKNKHAIDPLLPGFCMPVKVLDPF